MRKRIALLGAAVALAAIVVAGVSLASASSVATPPDSKLIAGPPTLTPPSADTTEGIDQVLDQNFTIQSAPSNAKTAISKEEALTAAKSMWPSYATSAKAVTIRHVVYTNRQTADLSDGQLAQMGVSERPENLDAWMVTFHKVALHLHGPLGQSRVAPDKNFVVFISSATGEQIEASGFGPVQ